MNPAIEPAIVNAVLQRDAEATDISVTDPRRRPGVAESYDLTLTWKSTEELKIGNVTATLIAPESPEPAILQALAASGIPAPGVFGTGVDGESDTTVLLTETLIGEPLSSLLAVIDMRWQISALAFTFARMLARVHTLDWRLVTPWLADPEAVPEDLIDDQVEAELSGWRDRAARLSEPARSQVERVLDWLELRRPVEVSLCLCHGSFTPDNVLIESDEVSGILNWQRSRVTDASYDLATLPFDLQTTGLNPEDAQLFAQAAYGAYLQSSPRGLANTAYYSVARPLVDLLDVLDRLEGAGQETQLRQRAERLSSMIKRAMGEAGRVPWRA
jgi:aminoglycoside phosphotransferase (APT) family kinase protein